jgi:glycosyltransferase involved in cell wall biosynthesis
MVGLEVRDELHELVRLPVEIQEMQGLKGAIARVFQGGLSVREQLACIGPKEIVRGSMIFRGRRQYAAWGQIEREMISGHRFITVQSKWLEAQVRAINNTSRIYHNDFALRTAFYTAAPWQSVSSVSILCSMAYPAPFKGLHVAIRALALLKRQYPGVELRIVGAHQWPGIHRDGYLSWLIHEARRLDVDANLRWLGSLSAQEIIAQLQECAAFVLPSFVEGYSLTLAEAMILGVPTVASYAGGIPSLAQDEDSVLFFTPGDAAVCAYQLERLLSDRALAERLSCRAREIALARNDQDRIVRCQIEIYRSVLQEAT